MGRRRSSASIALILLVLGFLGMAVVAVAWWPLPDVLGGKSVEMRPATATVVESAPCGTSSEGDRVELRVDGKVRTARLDGCGHNRGQRLPVQVPESRGGELVVQPGSPETTGDHSDLHVRVSWVLGTLAAVAGGGYVLLLRSAPRQSTSSAGASQVLH